MRVLRARGVVGPCWHDQAGARASQSRARDRWSAAHDVRPEEHAFAAGLTAAGNTFWRQGLPHARAAQRAAGRGTELRRAGSALGRRVEGRPSLPRARRRNPRTGSARMIKPKGLGRGLDALLGGDETPREALLTLPVARIRPGRYQPRTQMEQQGLADTAESIRSQGLMQPLLVRPVDRDRYELIAGERRWRAAQMAGVGGGAGLGREGPGETAPPMSALQKHPREE